MGAEHELSAAALPGAAEELFRGGYRLALVAAHDDREEIRVVYVLLAGSPDRRVELTLRVPAGHPQIPSLARLSFPAGRFEREMHDLFGVVPLGHPLPRRLVRHSHWPAGWYPMRAGVGPSPGFTGAEPYPFLTVEGQGVYEIPVGPVHAGVIEPGHFRFSVVGETIVKLKARLWFLHRGMERLFEGQDAYLATPWAERISGDTSAGHALAYCLAVEDALGLKLPARTQRQRALIVELERLYNHVADLGALANDAGFGIAHVHALRIRERLLRLNAMVTGHRLLRGALSPGGVQLAGLPDPTDLAEIGDDVAELVSLTLGHSVVRDRFTGTAVLSTRQARDLGCLGYVARSSGLGIDARIDHPFTPLPLTPVVVDGGDVLARYQVRAREVEASVLLLLSLVRDLGTRSRVTPSKEDHRDGRATSGTGQPPGTRGASHGLGIVEGWRGTIVHRVETDPAGILTRVKIVDPSWFNWPAVPLALRDTIVPDFPLTNKSFNLSYAGNDL